MIIETSDNRFYRVNEIPDPAMAHPGCFADIGDVIGRLEALSKHIPNGGRK